MAVSAWRHRHKRVFAEFLSLSRMFTENNTVLKKNWNDQKGKISHQKMKNCLPLGELLCWCGAIELNNPIVLIVLGHQ